MLQVGIRHADHGVRPARTGGPGTFDLIGVGDADEIVMPLI